MTTKTFIAAATLVLASSLAPSIASAAIDGAYEVNVATVQTGDLNLASEKGQSTLKARITAAITKVCGVSTGSIDLAQRRDIESCRAKARNAALAAAKVQQQQALAQR